LSLSRTGYVYDMRRFNDVIIIVNAICLYDNWLKKKKYSRLHIAKKHFSMIQPNTIFCLLLKYAAKKKTHVCVKETNRWCRRFQSETNEMIIIYSFCILILFDEKLKIMDEWSSKESIFKKIRPYSIIEWMSFALSFNFLTDKW
jgi:hypothetical protein